MNAIQEAGIPSAASGDDKRRVYGLSQKPLPENNRSCVGRDCGIQRPASGNSFENHVRSLHGAMSRLSSTREGFSVYPVTAPSLAEVASCVYFPSTPRV